MVRYTLYLRLTLGSIYLWTMLRNGMSDVLWVVAGGFWNFNGNDMIKWVIISYTIFCV